MYEINPPIEVPIPTIETTDNESPNKMDVTTMANNLLIQFSAAWLTTDTLVKT